MFKRAEETTGTELMKAIIDVVSRMKKMKSCVKMKEDVSDMSS